MIEISNILDVEKHIDGVDVVLFDLDDTLYPEKDYVKSGFDAIGRAYPNVKGLSKKLYLAFLDNKSAIDYVLEQEGLLKEKENCLFIYRNHRPTIKLFPCVYEMLKRIGKQKKLGLITDGRVSGQKSKIEVLGLDRIMDKIIITDELGGVEYRKPSTKSFFLMKEFFDSDYKKMCYVGDNFKKDSIAPKALGIRFIFFNFKDGIYKSN